MRTFIYNDVYLDWLGFMAHQPFIGYLIPNLVYRYIKYMICKCMFCR